MKTILFIDGRNFIGKINSALNPEKDKNKEIDIFSYNNRKYFLIHGGEYGNKGGTSKFFLYVIKEDGHVESVKSSWGGNFYWSCDEFREFCSLDYLFGYKDNLYLVIGGNIWEIDESDIFKERIYASAATFYESGLDFIKPKPKKERPAYLGFCSFNIQDSGDSSETKLPESLEKLNYGELITDEELCKKYSWFWTIFSNYCSPHEVCREKGIISNSPAERAGLTAGDIILEINENKLLKDRFGEIIAKHKPGDIINLKFLRKGEISVVPIKLEEKPEDLDPLFDTPTNIIQSKEIKEIYETCEFQGMACLAKGTKITMGDHSLKKIEDIKERDLVKSFDAGKDKIKNAEVIKIIKRKDPIVNINNELKAAPDELIYLADRSTKWAIKLKIGNVLFGEKTVYSIEYSSELVETYDLILKDANNFFANGYLVRTPDPTKS